MQRGRGRGGFDPYFDELVPWPKIRTRTRNHNHDRTDGPGGSRQHNFHPDDVQFHNPSRNAVNEHGFGSQIGCFAVIISKYRMHNFCFYF
jgi:hypothetical protein